MSSGGDVDTGFSYSRQCQGVIKAGEALRTGSGSSSNPAHFEDEDENEEETKALTRF